MLYLYLMCLTGPNLTEQLIELFGWDFMQSLWPILNTIYDAFSFAFGEEIALKIWERALA